MSDFEAMIARKRGFQLNKFARLELFVTDRDRWMEVTKGITRPVDIRVIEHLLDQVEDAVATAEKHLAVIEEAAQEIRA